MKLWAISDLHLSHVTNKRALETVAARPHDWLIVAGDVGEDDGNLDFCFDVLQRRFAKLIWVPGNHELWTMRGDPLRGEAKYSRLVALCRRAGVLTPEDPYPVFDGEGGPRLVAPLFAHYDYSFCPPGMTPPEARARAAAAGIESADERRLFSDPYASSAEWCAARVAVSESRLDEATTRSPLRTVLVNHYPLRHELATLPRIPEFEAWCGTRLTERWHIRYRAEVVVFGHLHIRQTRFIDGVRFEEVSLGYARQWNQSRSVDSYLRQILPSLRA